MEAFKTTVLFALMATVFTEDSEDNTKTATNTGRMVEMDIVIEWIGFTRDRVTRFESKLYIYPSQS